jgi:hypothetical protein
MDHYLHELNKRLMDHQISDELLNQLMNTYKERLQKNDPNLKDVAYEVETIIDQYDLKLKETERHDILSMIALYPFISLNVYLILGFVFDFWHPGWLVFFLIPIIMLVFSVFHDDISAAILALIPFFIVLSYFLIGFYIHLWHPTWLIFLLIPIIGIFTTSRRRNIKYILFTLSPLISISLYLVFGFYLSWWNQAWVVFLLVPMLACLQESNLKRRIIYELSLLLAFIIGFILPYFTSSWGFSFFGLIIPSLAFVSTGEDSLIKFTKDTTIDWIIFVSLAFIYLAFGLFMNGWAYGWMILLLMPIYEIAKQSTEHFKFYYVMPFLSIAVFFSLGYFYAIWQYAWLVFALPIILYFIERD